MQLKLTVLLCGLQAPSEAESQCAAMCKQGLVCFSVPTQLVLLSAVQHDHFSMKTVCRLLHCSALPTDACCQQLDMQEIPYSLHIHSFAGIVMCNMYLYTLCICCHSCVMHLNHCVDMHPLTVYPSLE